MGKLINIVGLKFSRLTIESRAPNQQTRAAWNCACECGNRVVVDGKKLRTGHTKSCGCYRVEVTAPAQGRKNLKHGMSRTPEYTRAKGAEREAAERRHTPKWANREAIMQIYLNKPDGHHVDHVIPLRGKLVSGLHVESNLQYLTAEANMRKHNTFKVEEKQ